VVQGDQLHEDQLKMPLQDFGEEFVCHIEQSDGAPIV
jgi:hypothetical protein